MTSQDPKTFLWSNIALLMGAESPTVDAVQRRTKVGRGTVQRIKEGETSVGTDKLLAIADAFNVEPWTLLHPALDKTAPRFEESSSAQPTLAQALEVVVAAISALPQPSRRALSEDLALLAVAPGDPETRHRVATALQAGPSITEKLLSIPSLVESPRLPQRVTEK